MVGITLTAEQIRSAPPEVRHWIESQVAAMFAPPATEEAHAAPPHLAQCTAGEAQAILEQIEDLLPVVSVFFELGRESASVPVQGMRAFRLNEIARHTRLETTQQVLEALELINDALRRVRRDSEAMLCGFDREGRCYVSEATSRAVLTLWRGIVAQHALAAGQPAEPAAEAPAPVYRSPGYNVTMPGLMAGTSQPVIPVEHVG
ncbi:MAG TPA: hypothetical protein VGG99_28925 [Acetobacteraceae bacterium]